MSTRLLYFLSMIEEAIVQLGGSAAASSRMVNYHKGLARMTFTGGGALHLQHFGLADGQICVKAALYWPRCEAPAMHAIYPNETFHWRGAAAKVAEIWMDGPEASGITHAAEDAAPPALEKLEAVG